MAVHVARAQPASENLFVRNLSPSAGQVGFEATNAFAANTSSATIPFGEAVKNRPLKFIEVGDLPPPGGEESLEDAVDPNQVAADEYFSPTALTFVRLRGILKLTGRTQEIDGKVGDALTFGNLEIVVHKCSSVMDQGERGAAALLEITEFTASGSEKALFRGWLFSTSPSLSSIKHPEYDLLLQGCDA